MACVEDDMAHTYTFACDNCDKILVQDPTKKRPVQDFGVSARNPSGPGFSISVDLCDDCVEKLTKPFRKFVDPDADARDVALKVRLDAMVKKS